MEDNLFGLSLDMILGESTQYYSMITETYYINEETLIDKIKQFDFKKIFSFILNKFLNIIKTIWAKFKKSYHEFSLKTNLLKKYRKKLESIDYDVEVTSGYPEIKNLYNPTNMSMFNMSLNNEYNSMIQSLESILQCKNISDIHSLILSTKEKMDSVSNYLNQQRGISLLSDSSIPESEFSKTVFDYFYSENNIINTISAEQIQTMTRDYFEDKKLEKCITKDETTLRRAAEQMIGKINNIRMEKYCPSQLLNNEVSVAFLDIIRASCNKVYGLCNIYVQLFSIKLDLVRLYKQQQTKTLCKVILKSIEEGRM